MSPQPTELRDARRTPVPFAHRWQALALSAATGLALGLPALDAHALALGRLTVQSALGEPLRAEIDVPQISPDEVASLQATLASPEAFRAAGVERSQALNDLRITLQQRPGDGYVLRLSSERSITEPFVDLIIEANWSAGRVVRDYTLLFDPPALRPAAPAPQAAQLTAPAEGTGSAAAPARPAPPPVAAPAPAPAGPGPARKVTVNAGDTAGRLAAANKPATVSLDQMLVALLRANPDAFIGGNVNRLRAGAVLELPTAEQAQALDAKQARQTVVAQSRDFNEFRRRLAESKGLAAPAAAPAGREASGKVEARVEEKASSGAAPDKLRLSKGAVQGGTSEDRLARDRDARDAATRVAELERNIAELNRLGAASGPAGAPAAPAASAASGTGLAVGTTPVVPASAASAASLPASAPASAPAAAASAPASSAARTPKRPASTPAPAAGAGWLASLQDQALLPLAAGGALALLLGLFLWRRRSAAQSGQVDSSFLESKLQPDSFFGGSGGQRIDTAEEGPATGNSMVYSPSQIDAAGDVDPVAEADVYLAYGRDLQAEEILKEALRINPQRVAIMAKLLEIHARRGDVRAFEPLAREAHALTRGKGPEWNHIAGMGRDLLPEEPLFQAGDDAEPADLAAPAAPAQPQDNPDTEPMDWEPPAPIPAPAPAPAPAAIHPVPPPAPLDIDLDELDLDLVSAEPPAPAPAPAAPAPAAPAPELHIEPLDEPQDEEPAAEPEPSPKAVPEPEVPDSLDLDLASFQLPASADLAPASGPIDFDPEIDLPVAEPANAEELPPAPAAPVADPLMDFDLGSISLDLDVPSESPAQATAPESADPLETKLSLAEEFRAIGDVEGARSLAEEVRDEASGELRQRAERLLADLG